MSTGDLSGVTVTRCMVQVPSWGVWWADVELDQPATLTGQLTLTLGGSEFVGTIMSGGPVQGRARYRLAGGAGGWGQEIPAHHYAADNGVKMISVLVDAATLAGETLEDIPAGSVGIAWTREEGPASWQLEALYPAGWYVGEDGVTRIGARASSEYSGAAARVEPADLAIGKAVLAADSLEGLTPGVVVDGLTATDVWHDLDAGKLRTTVWGAGRSDTSRGATAFRRLVEAVTSGSRWRGIWDYRVVTQSGERLNLQAVKRATGLPDLRRVKARLAPGVRATWTPGSLCLVSFVDGDRARPVVIGGDDPESPGWMPTELDLGSSPRLGVARLGDTVQAGPFAGVITSASATVKAGA